MKNIFFPKKNLVKTSSLLFVIGLMFVIPNVFAQPLVYPTAAPSGEVTGGYFSRVLQNIFAPCPAWQVIAGFEFPSNSLLDPNTGKPKCVLLNNLNGQASSLTGAMMGENNRIPMWSDSGRFFTGSIMKQIIPTEANTLPWNTMEVDGHLSIGTLGLDRALGTEIWGKLFFEGASMNSDPIALYRYNLTNDRSELRLALGDNFWNSALSDVFRIGTFGSPNFRRDELSFRNGVTMDPSGRIGIKTELPNVELDVIGNFRLDNVSKWNGKILTSNANGLSSWKKFSEIFQITDARNDFITAMKNVFSTLCIPTGTGQYNVCHGEGALQKNTIGNANIAIGGSALRDNVQWYGNVAVGESALKESIDGRSNTAIGRSAAIKQKNAHSNTAIGAFSLFDNISGERNTAVGVLSAQNMSSGSENVSVGIQSLDAFISGYGNTSLGSFAGANLKNGDFNTSIGYGAWSGSINGQYNIAIGAHTTFHTSSGSNQLNIGNWIYGSGGDIGIGVATPIAKLDIAGKIKITDGTQGSGKILMSDENGLARWEKAEFGTGINPNDCSATSKNVNGHSYSIIALTNGNSYISTFIENIANGRRQWNQGFLCDRGNLWPSGGELSEIFCNNGYISTGTSCILPDTNMTANCTAKTMIINGRTYNVPSINHNFSVVSYSALAIENGTTNYKQTFECNNGVTRASGSEEIISRTCNAGYAWNGNACVLGGNQEIVSVYEGTMCNVANIQIVDITPGLDKIPENLNANTLYRLQSGIYEISKKINTNTCSAIVGAGKDKTTIQYVGLSFGSENLIEVTKTQAVLKNFSILGKKDGAGTMARAINIVKGANKIITENVRIQNAVVTGINIGSRDNTIKNVEITDIRSAAGDASGIQLDSSSNNILENIVISNVFAFKSSYGIQLTSSDSYYSYYSSSPSSINNTLRNITISNISISSKSSYSSSYGIQLSSSNNILTNIAISNVSVPAPSSYSYGIRLSSSNNTLTNITISNVSTNNSYGIYLSSSNNTLTNITISNVSASYSSCGIQLTSSSSSSPSSNNTLRNITISNISTTTSAAASSYGIRLSSSNNTLTNIIISNISASTSSSYYSDPSYGIQLASHGDIFNDAIFNNAISNFSVTKAKKWIEIQDTLVNNIFHNGIIYKNSEEGILVNGNNNTFSNISVYDNASAISGNGNSNFYYGALRVFNNGNNSVSILGKGLSTHWLGGFLDGNIITTDSYSDVWSIRLTTVSGYNHNQRGPQMGLTWILPITWVYGNSVPRQIAPVISSTCNLSVTSVSKCRPTFGGTDTYNATKKIGEW